MAQAGGPEAGGTSEDVIPIYRLGGYSENLLKRITTMRFLCSWVKQVQTMFHPNCLQSKDSLF